MGNSLSRLHAHVHTHIDTLICPRACVVAAQCLQPNWQEQRKMAINGLKFEIHRNKSTITFLLSFFAEHKEGWDQKSMFYHNTPLP